MKAVVAVLMGLFSGFLIYMILAMMFVNPGADSGPSTALVLLSFLGGWALSTWLLMRGARSVSKVFSRGFLLGAAEWLLMGLAGLVFSGKAVSSTIQSSGASGAGAAGAALGGGMVA